MKKLLSIILVISLLLGSFSFAASAKADTAAKINLKTARNIATLYLATLEPFSVSPAAGSPEEKEYRSVASGAVAEARTVKLGKDFKLLKERPLYNINEETAFYNFDFISTADENIRGYITVSVNSDLPFVMEQGFGASPYAGEKVIKTYYIGPTAYFNQMADGTTLDQAGEKVERAQIEKSFKDYNAYRNSLYLQNSGFIKGVMDENSQTLTVIKGIKSADFWSNLTLEKINDYLLVLFNYFIGSIWHNVDIAQINTSVEELIKEDAGEGCTVVESSIVDKTYMIPHTQSYYELNAGSGICGKASSVMALAFYRDGMGYTALPDDAAIYAELSAIYDAMTEYFGFFFNDPTVNDMGLSESYEMLGTLDMGLAYYLYSKGYEDAAQNVIDNMCFSITLVPDALSNSLMKILRLLMTQWLSDQTGGALTLHTGANNNPDDVIINTLKKGEPVVIGSLAAIGCDWFSNHYFAGVGYYKIACDVKINGSKVYTLNKEYIEVYDTWGSHSSVMNWSVFKSTALYSATSMADV